MDGKNLVSYDPFARVDYSFDLSRLKIVPPIRIHIEPNLTLVILNGVTFGQLHHAFRFGEVCKEVSGSSVDGFVYTAETETGPEVIEAVEGLLSAFGFSESERDDPRYGSYFQRFRSWMQDKVNSQAGVDAREKAQRALELKLLDKEQAGVDSQQAEAVARVISALEKTERCALLVGSLLVVKTQEVLVARKLTQREMLLLSMNPELQMQPERLLELLRQAQRERECEPGASMSEVERNFRTVIEKRAG